MLFLGFWVYYARARSQITMECGYNHTSARWLAVRKGVETEDLIFAPGGDLTPVLTYSHAYSLYNLRRRY